MTTFVAAPVPLAPTLAPEHEQHHAADHPHDMVHQMLHELHEQNYHRIDEELLQKNLKFLDTSAIHGTLRGEHVISRYEIYQKGDGHEICALVEIGDHLCGHPGIVHGGIISALFDNTLGWLFIAMHQPPAFTANLSINYRLPMPSKTVGLIKAQVKEIDGRKVHVHATWERNGHVYADATALFIKPKHALAETIRTD